jgi:hypothetical protein
MDDSPTGQLFRQDGPARSAATEPAGTEPAATEPADNETTDTEVGEVGTAAGIPAGGSRADGRRTGGRRYRAGHPPAQRPRASEQPRLQTTPFRSGVGASGALGALFACSLISCLLAAWLRLTVVAGLGFCAGCAVAAWYCRPAALLRMVTAVPTVLAAAEILAQLATLHGNWQRHGLVLPVAGGTLLTLAAVAPWLFGGTAGAVAIALFRGLPRCVSDLRGELRGRTPGRPEPRARHAPRAQQARRG